MGRASLWAVSLCFVAAAARAQDAAEPEVAGLDAEAHALYDAGEVAFHEGRFENALDYFQRAYELSHRPELLYNVGTTADRLRRDEEALAAFEEYLAELPTARNRGEVESRIAVLRAAIAEAAPGPEDHAGPPDEERVVVPEPEPTPAPTTPSSGPGAGPWVVLGVGGIAAVTGAVLLGLAAADVAAVENAPMGSTWASVADAYGRSEAESITGAILLGVGGAAMIGGLVWGVLPSGSSDTAARIEIVPTPGGAVVRGSF